MNQYHLQLVNERLAEHRAEADRYRLARSGHTAAGAKRTERRRRQPGRDGGMLSSLLGRVALY